jgi:hypothetical protein
MNSGWILIFKDWPVALYTEEGYKEYCNCGRESDIQYGYLICEEHWFDIEKGKEKYNLV